MENKVKVIGGTDGGGGSENSRLVAVAVQPSVPTCEAERVHRMAYAYNRIVLTV